MSTTSDSSNMSEQSDIPVTSERYASRLIRQLDIFRMRKNFCDYKIKSGNETLHVHKVVMAGSSGYFKAMLTSEMREKHEDSVTLDAVDTVGLRGAIEFAYTGNVSTTKTNIYSFVQAAAYLQISDMLKECEKYLASTTDVENCLEVMNLAGMYLLPTAEKSCMKVIIKNMFKLSKEERNTLSYRQLLEMFGDVRLQVKCESSLTEVIVDWLKANKSVDINDSPNVADCKTLGNSWVVIFTELSCKIRWSLMSPKEFQENVSDGFKCVLRQIPRCQALLKTAKRYHSDIYKQPLKQSVQSRVRFTGLSLVSSGQSRYAVFNLYTKKQSKSAQFPDDYVYVRHECLLNVNNFLYTCGGVVTTIGAVVEDLPFPKMQTSNQFLRYDPRFNKWLALSPMKVPRVGFVMVRHNKHIYVIGGFSKNNAMTKKCERYDIATNTWSYIPDLPTCMVFHAGCVAKDVIYVGGGCGTNRNVISSLYTYDIQKQCWNRDADMDTPRSRYVMAKVGQSIYVMGGNRQPLYNEPEAEYIDYITDDVEQYSLDTKIWKSIIGSTGSYLMSDAECYVRGKRVYIFGGMNIEIDDTDDMQYTPHDVTVIKVDKPESEYMSDLLDTSNTAKVPYDISKVQSAILNMPPFHPSE